MKVTPYDDINILLDDFTKCVEEVLKECVVGVYLMGSLTYGDFIRERSDIDLAVVTRKLISQEKIGQIKLLHIELEQRHAQWKNKIECQYIPLEMFRHVLPDGLERPYHGGGIFYPDALYGNEWLINNYLLYKHGISLVGPEFKTLIKPIDIKEVQRASIQDLFAEWVPKIGDANFFEDSHSQWYVVLNLCRILYTVMQGDVRSKKVSTEWVKNEFPQWTSLVEMAERWKYSDKINAQKEVEEFIKFATVRVKEKEL